MGAVGEVGPVLSPVLDIPGHRLILHDRACHQLGEQGHIQAHIHGIFLSLRLATGHVKHIAHSLKGEEGDADGQLDAEQGQLPAQQIQGADGKVQVLEHEQQGQVDHRRQHHRRPYAAPCRAGAARPQAQQIVGKDGAEHQQQRLMGTPAVEEQGGQEQEHILPRPPAPQGEVVHQQHGREKGEQKNRAGKYHRQRLVSPG